MGAFFGQTVEWSVNPFAGRDRVLQRYVNSRPPENPDAEANIRWGGKSTWQFVSGGGFQPHDIIVNLPESDPDTPEEAPEEITLDFDEVTREETEVRVENPDDADQYVIVKNVDVIVFKGPDLRPPELIGREGRQQEIYYRYTLHTPEE